MEVLHPLGRASVSSFSPSLLSWEGRVRVPWKFLGPQLSSFFDSFLRSLVGLRRLRFYPFSSSFPCVLIDESFHHNYYRVKPVPFTFFSTLCAFSESEPELAMVEGNPAVTSGSSAKREQSCELRPGLLVRVLTGAALIAHTPFHLTPLGHRYGSHLLVNFGHPV